eukprot:CAMPEP_0117560444 /NCGR_PEP_ID=MMETSP0784-20121206/53878_1 /TAXON_ID=39447 /ORGANISM="" /LENGTH=163 /DNA_ID=CAMNT_0005357851 /DNA_START=145 /DNA_END=636 /DNA_ORIENTATION=-
MSPQRGPHDAIHQQDGETLLRFLTHESQLVLDLSAVAIHEGPPPPANVDARHVERNVTQGRLREDVGIVHGKGHDVFFIHIGSVDVERPRPAFLEHWVQIIADGLGFVLFAPRALHADVRIREVPFAINVLEVVAGDDLDAEDADTSKRGTEIAMDCFVTVGE